MGALAVWFINGVEVDVVRHIQIESHKIQNVLFAKLYSLALS